MYKWIGAFFILIGCGSVGFSIAAGYRRKARLLRQFNHILQYMEKELQYRLTPLPELCRQAGKEADGCLKEFFFQLSSLLNRQTMSDVSTCMTTVLRNSKDIPPELRKLLLHLGRILGRFDLSGQLQGLRAVRAECRENIQYLDHDRDNRIRSYQTLGICAGAALVVLLA